jgi:hypothetical protein
MRALPLLAALALSLVSAAAYAATYHIGGDQQYATIQDLLEEVTPVDNDVILVHPGTYPAFRIEKGGGSSPETAPVIRAYDMSDRPVFDAAGAANCCEFNHGVGKWYALEGVEICNASMRGVFNVECGLVLRHCYIHDCRNGFMGGMHNTRDSSPGYLIAEHNEFARNGQGVYAHQLYVQEYWTVFRYNYIHDNTGGTCYKDRSRYSLVAYNLIEQGDEAMYTIEFCGCGDDAAPSYTQTAVMIGNIVTKHHGGNRWLFVGNERKEGGAEGHLNIGRLHLINNVFYSEEHTGPIIGDDEGSIITAHNNIFHSTTSTGIAAPVDMADGPGRFEESRNNWVRTGMAVPDAFVDTVFGDGPGCVNIAWQGGDFHLAPGSPCIDAAYQEMAPAVPLEYAHPSGYTFRLPDEALDIGPFEYCPRPPAGARVPVGPGAGDEERPGGGSAP